MRLAHWIWAAGTVSAALSLSACGVQEPDPVRDLPGYWDWAPGMRNEAERGPACSGALLHIWLTEGGQRYHSSWTTTDAEVTSRILEDLPAALLDNGERDPKHGFLIQYEDETRIDADGNPVSWYLVMSAPDRFFWQRLDRIGVSTRNPTMVRCPDPN